MRPYSLKHFSLTQLEEIIITILSKLKPPRSPKYFGSFIMATSALVMGKIN